MTGTVLSADGIYRYTLERELEDGAGTTVAFIMLNPSTADAEQDDPTIRRCKGYAKLWGFSRLLVGNLFAFRATDPKELVEAPGAGIDIVGPFNDYHLELIGRQADMTVCAWGAHKLAAPRAREATLPKSLCALKVTKSGAPGHPLYLPKNLTPVSYEVPA